MWGCVFAMELEGVGVVVVVGFSTSDFRAVQVQIQGGAVHSRQLWS